MAVRIPRADLTDEKQKLIRSSLRFQGKPEFFIKPGPGVVQPEITEVFFYQTLGEEFHEDETKTPWKEVLVPYAFGRVLTGGIGNSKKNYPKLDMKFTGTLRDYQVEVYNEASQQLDNSGTTILGVYPGFGKTILAANLVVNKGFHVVILVHRDFLATQWKVTFTEYTNTKESEIYIVPDAVGRKKNPFPDILPKVLIVMDQRWSSVDEKIRQQYGILVIDEAHCWCSPSRVNCMLGWEPKYVIAETATLTRTDGMHEMIHALCGYDQIFRKSQKPFEVFRVNTGFSPEVQMSSRGTLDYNALIQSCIESERCNQIIIDIVKQNSDRKILILSNRNEHVQTLFTAIGKFEKSVDWYAGNKKSYKNSRVLVAGANKVNTGFDESTACPDYDGIRINTLIIATSIKSLAANEQSCGRVFRSENPRIYYLVHDNPTFKRHWTGCKKWFLSRQAIITEINMESTEKKKILDIHGNDITPVGPEDDPEDEPEDEPVVKKTRLKITPSVPKPDPKPITRVTLPKDKPAPKPKAKAKTKAKAKEEMGPVPNFDYAPLLAEYQRKKAAGHNLPVTVEDLPRPTNLVIKIKRN